ncbi:MAG: hypothetical protein U0931_20100 [Vulcanimicrobiota bacterium]
MPIYEYTARDLERMPVTGSLEAANLRAAVTQLQQQKMTVLSIRLCRACACGEIAPRPGGICKKCGRVAPNPVASFLKLLALGGLAAVVGHLLHWF